MIRNLLTPFLALTLGASMVKAQPAPTETAAQYAARMRWWKEARFGLFIHWGLYAIPAGEANGTTDHGEWIRTTAQIPVGAYDTLVRSFNPVKFDAREWARMAREAGMRYLTITSKHHDGFALFDSKTGGFDVMATPFGRDVLQEVAGACRAEGLALCWYHSIMDWHHPDYLPRREWEKDRSAEGADFDRYVRFLKDQVKELLTNYGTIGVLWFDGEWESTWNRERGRDLYDYVRALQPGIIVNNRVGAGRSGMEGFSEEGEASAGDFGTPEQQVPANGIPGVYWETCMTMNDHWGYNKVDSNWKSATELVRTLVDVVSKGGNFLLNVGPTAEGLFPPEAVDRLKEIGRWMAVNGESIYGTDAGPFPSLEWGRCTRKDQAEGTRLFLHLFQRPASGRIIVPGIFNAPRGAYLLADGSRSPLSVSREEDALVVSVGAASNSSDTADVVVVLDLTGKADVALPPVIDTTVTIFVDAASVGVSTARDNVEVRYTVDGTGPMASSPLVAGRVRLTESATISARCFREGKPVSPPASARFMKVAPKAALGRRDRNLVSGIRYRYYEGDWDSLPDFDALRPAREGGLPNVGFGPRKDAEHFGFVYEGYIEVPETGVYTFATESDDGSRLFIANALVVDNDGLHAMQRRKGATALAKGLHQIRVEFFEKSGGDGLLISWEGPGFALRPIPEAALFSDR